MERERIKEDLSICYLKTIAAIAGIALEETRHDEDSIDIIIKKIIGFENGRKFNSQISVQLKTTSSISQYSANDEYITYKLKVKNYNDLCTPASMPSMLALLILPENKEEWVNWTPEELMIKGQMYWMSFQNNDSSNNDDNIRVKIPIINVLNIHTLEELLLKAAEEGEL